MTFDDYQKQASTTAQYSDSVPPLAYLSLGLAGETGEVVDKIKKVFRNQDGQFSPDTKTEIAKELGDVLWYLSQLAKELDVSLEEIAKANLTKLFDRVERGVIKSAGDNR